MRRLAARATALSVVVCLAPCAWASSRLHGAKHEVADAVPMAGADPAEDVSADSEAGRQRLAARHMAQRAMDLMRKERWADAQALLKHAYELVPAPTLAVLEGDALVRMGELNKAVERFEAAQRTELDPEAPEAYRRAVRLAKERLLAIKARIPRLIIAIKGVGDRDEPLSLWLNDEPLSPDLLGIERRLDPGQYTVRAELRGKTLSQQIDLREGSTERVVLDPDAESAPPEPMDRTPNLGSTRRRTAGWISLGVGGAGLVTGVVAGVITQNKEENLKAVCNPECAPQLRDEVNALEAARTTSWVGYGVGLAGIATGVALLLTSRDTRSDDMTPRPYATLRTVGLTGKF